MSEIEFDTIAFVRLSGEPVYVLGHETKQEYVGGGWFHEDRWVPVVTNRLLCRRFIRSEKFGTQYQNEGFRPEELESEADFRKKFEEEEARVMKQFAAQGGEIVVEGVSAVKTENLA